MENLFQKSAEAIENFLAEFTVVGNETFGYKSNGDVDIFNSGQNTFKGLVASTRIVDICDFDDDLGYVLNRQLLADFINMNTKTQIEY
jgi:hypothetical protein